MPARRRFPPERTDLLVLADEGVERERLVRILTQERYRVRSHGQVLPGLDELEEYPPDLLVLALVGDREKSTSCLRTLREQCPQYTGAVLLASDPGGVPTRKVARELKIRHFLGRPFRDDQFLYRVETALRSRRMEDQLAASARQLQEDIALASTVQQSLLPLPPPERPGLELAAAYRASHLLGGDFFDVLDLGEGGTGLFVADVVGHGVAAALFTALLKAQLAQARARGLCGSPGETLAELNAAMAEIFDRSGRFITAVYATLSPEAETLRLSSAGHPAAILLPRGEELRTVDVGGLPLGVVSSVDYPQAEIPFRPGDRLYLFTDGAFEQTWHGKGRLFGKRKLEEVLAAGRERSLTGSVEAVIEELLEWCGSEGLSDDVNVLGIERVAWKE